MTAQKPKKSRSRKADVAPMCLGELYVGGMRVRVFKEGVFWMENKDGEGTMVLRKELEAVLQELFIRLF